MELKNILSYLKMPFNDDLNYKILSKDEVDRLLFYIEYLETNLHCGESYIQQLEYRLERRDIK